MEPLRGLTPCSKTEWDSQRLTHFSKCSMSTHWIPLASTPGICFSKNCMSNKSRLRSGTSGKVRVSTDFTPYLLMHWIHTFRTKQGALIQQSNCHLCSAQAVCLKCRAFTARTDSLVYAVLNQQLCPTLTWASSVMLHGLQKCEAQKKGGMWDVSTTHWFCQAASDI